ncbi:hypothetical protein LMG26858_06224 [Achromobacter anxifer]|uniref:Uncharacterized protein n=1 Tax=Achromobacter anxifer TaxID=1287737 RepID=A0A6S7EY46_9BURK|nr:hypothetical protein [Achromobacter anxifer]CAB3928418.1 hypothetical protein LMG26858_06224 [Achromobacter anxifer]CAB5511353.1 hypothetical protein LMG26857_00640 [Achromobacter anxifer]
MIDVPLTLLKAGEAFATETISLLPVAWAIGLLLCIESDLPLLRSTTWRLLRNVIVALMALFLVYVIVYAIYGLAVAVYFDDHGFTNLTLRTLSTMWVSIALASAGVALWIYRRSRQNA